jgi:hypothetical protein
LFPKFYHPLTPSQREKLAEKRAQKPEKTVVGKKSAQHNYRKGITKGLRS